MPHASLGQKMDCPQTKQNGGRFNQERHPNMFRPQQFSFLTKLPFKARVTLLFPESLWSFHVRKDHPSDGFLCASRPLWRLLPLPPGCGRGRPESHGPLGFTRFLVLFLGFLECLTPWVPGVHVGRTVSAAGNSGFSLAFLGVFRLELLHHLG